MVDTLVRWDPFRDLLSIQDELNRLFGRTYGGQEPSLGRTGGSWVPPMDIYETAETLVAKMELPGIEPGDVDVSVEDSALTVSGKREISSETKEESFHRIERRYGSFSRTIALPATVDTAKVDATFDKGVLTIEFHKSERAKPKRISVKAVG
jgi:HSP20 family protein